MTEKSSNRWLLLSAVMIILSIILLLLPANERERQSRDARESSAEGADSALYVEQVIDGDTFLLSDGGRSD